MPAFLCRFLRRPRKSDRQTTKLRRGSTDPERAAKDASQTGDEAHIGVLRQPCQQVSLKTQYTSIAPSTSNQWRPPARQDSQSEAIPTTLEAIRDSTLGLETQAPLFDAFSELARHVRPFLARTTVRDH